MSDSLHGTAALDAPFPGLRAFEAEESLLFYGREGHVAELLDRLGDNCFGAVTGTSGSGKSSLVRAGLRPALERGYLVDATTRWRFATMRPGSAPIQALAESLAGALGGEPLDAIVQSLSATSAGLSQVVGRARLGRGESLLIIADQFEELFRYEDQTRDQESNASLFVSLLLEATEQREAPILDESTRHQAAQRREHEEQRSRELRPAQALARANRRQSIALALLLVGVGIVTFVLYRLVEKDRQLARATSNYQRVSEVNRRTLARMSKLEAERAELTRTAATASPADQARLDQLTKEIASARAQAQGSQDELTKLRKDQELTASDRGGLLKQIDTLRQERTLAITERDKLQAQLNAPQRPAPSQSPPADDRVLTLQRQFDEERKRATEALAEVARLKDEVKKERDAREVAIRKGTADTPIRVEIPERTAKLAGDTGLLLLRDKVLAGWDVYVLAGSGPIMSPFSSNARTTYDSVLTRLQTALKSCDGHSVQMPGPVEKVTAWCFKVESLYGLNTYKPLGQVRKESAVLNVYAVAVDDRAHTVEIEFRPAQ